MLLERIRQIGVEWLEMGLAGHYIYCVESPLLAEEPKDELVDKIGHAIEVGAITREEILDVVVERLFRELAARDAINARQKEEIAFLKRQIFGTKSEKLIDPSADSADLFGFESQDTVVVVPERVIPAGTRTTKGHGREVLPEWLERRIRVVDLPENEKICSCCGVCMCAMPEREVSEVLHLEAPKMWVERIERIKYVCPTNPENGVHTGPVPEAFIDKGLANLDVILWIVIAKFMDHIPLHRVKSQIKRWGNGLEVAESTMVGWIAAVFDLLGPIQRAMEHEIRSTGWMHLDETHLRVQLGEENSLGRGITSTCYLWAMVGRYRNGTPMGVSFRYEDNRRIESAVRVLGSFQGLFVSDRYRPYDSAVDQIVKSARDAGKRIPEIKHAFCWAHVRRKFNDALLNGHKPAKVALDMIAAIYRAESKCQKEVEGIDDLDTREQKLLAARTELLAPTIDRFFAWTREAERHLQPHSFKKALDYTTNQEQGFRMVLSEASCDLDNNVVERAIRAVAIGRKNWEFAGSENGANRLACLLSIIGTCKLLDLDPEKYLTWALMEAKRRKAKGNLDVSDLTPAKWLERCKPV